jgi:hypothetical protein
VREADQRTIFTVAAYPQRAATSHAPEAPTDALRRGCNVRAERSRARAKPFP